MNRNVNVVESMLWIAALFAFLMTAVGPAMAGQTKPQASSGSDASSKAAMVSVDPFKSLFIPPPQPPPTPPDVIVKECPAGNYIEDRSLDQLQLVGIILTSSKKRALFQESSGKGHIFPEGACVGSNNSRILRIKNDRVVFQDKTKDFRGDVTVNKRVMMLRKGK